jgi:hypothetical protein
VAGWKYEGAFANGQPDGHGIKSKGPESYAGVFKEGQIVAIGIHRKAGGAVYEGPFRDWEEDGAGKLSLPNGDRYEGEFHGGVIAGTGTFYWADGDSWMGPWANNGREGKGVYTFKNGNRYVGTWRNDRTEGRGVYVYRDGTQQQAEFEGGKRVLVGEKEVDVSNAIKAGSAVEISAGQNYLLDWDIKIGVHTDWTVWADGPFELNVKGVRSLVGPIPNPFDSGWQSAARNFKGISGVYGLEGSDGGISWYLVARTTQPSIRLRAKSGLVGPGEITIHITMKTHRRGIEPRRS